MKPSNNKLLSRFIAYDMNQELADRAGDLIREGQERRVSLGVPDAIFAATALREKRRACKETGSPLWVPSGAGR